MESGTDDDENDTTVETSDDVRVHDEDLSSNTNKEVCEGCSEIAKRKLELEVEEVKPDFKKSKVAKIGKGKKTKQSIAMLSDSFKDPAEQEMGMMVELEQIRHKEMLEHDIYLNSSLCSGSYEIPSKHKLVSTKTLLERQETIRDQQQQKGRRYKSKTVVWPLNMHCQLKRPSSHCHTRRHKRQPGSSDLFNLQLREPVPTQNVSTDNRPINALQKQLTTMIPKPTNLVRCLTQTSSCATINS